MCEVVSIHRPTWEGGIYAAKGNQFFVALHDRRIFIGSAERYAFPWRNPDGPFDDLNVAGPAEKTAFAA